MYVEKITFTTSVISLTWLIRSRMRITVTAILMSLEVNSPNGVVLVCRRSWSWIYRMKPN